MLPLTSVSFWTLKMKTPSRLVERTAATPSANRESSGDRKRSWDMFSRRTVMLFVSISSVMMVTRRVQKAITWWMPSKNYKNNHLLINQFYITIKTQPVSSIRMLEFWNTSGGSQLLPDYNSILFSL